MRVVLLLKLIFRNILCYKCYKSEFTIYVSVLRQGKYFLSIYVEKPFRYFMRNRSCIIFIISKTINICSHRVLITWNHFLFIKLSKSVVT